MKVLIFILLFLLFSSSGFFIHIYLLNKHKLECFLTLFICCKTQKETQTPSSTSTNTSTTAWNLVLIFLLSKIFFFLSVCVFFFQVVVEIQTNSWSGATCVIGAKTGCFNFANKISRVNVAQIQQEKVKGGPI